jgi:hypothetical protein
MARLAEFSRRSIEDVLREAVNTPRCACGCGRYSMGNKFAGAECFNAEAEDVIY